MTGNYFLLQVCTSKTDIFRNGIRIIDHNRNYPWDGTTTDRVTNLGQAGDIRVSVKITMGRTIRSSEKNLVLTYVGNVKKEITKKLKKIGGSG